MVCVVACLRRVGSSINANSVGWLNGVGSLLLWNFIIAMALIMTTELLTCACFVRTATLKPRIAEAKSSKSARPEWWNGIHE